MVELVDFQANNVPVDNSLAKRLRAGDATAKAELAYMIGDRVVAGLAMTSPAPWIGRPERKPKSLFNSDFFWGMLLGASVMLPALGWALRQ